MTTLTAKYRGLCAKTRAVILPGDLIDYRKGRAVLVKRNRGSDYSDSMVIGDKSFIRNARGLCEDAPCCGCCTI